uniref:Uncharacterized protein n=1 Tax=Glycine max TaxID=3847 RepID=A0A0R0I9W5_SOYBN
MVSFALLSWADLTSKSITALGIGVSDPPPALCLFARFLSVFFFIFCLLISEALKVVSEKQVQLLDWILIPLRSNQSFFQTCNIKSCSVTRLNLNFSLIFQALYHCNTLIFLIYLLNRFKQTHSVPKPCFGTNVLRQFLRLRH